MPPMDRDWQDCNLVHRSEAGDYGSWWFLCSHRFPRMETHPVLAWPVRITVSETGPLVR